MRNRRLIPGSPGRWIGLSLSASLIAAGCLAWLTPIRAQQSADPLRQMMRDVLGHIQITTRTLADFAYTRYNVRRQFDSDGKLTSEHTFRAKRSFIDDYGYTIQVERDGKPVPKEEVERGEQAARDRMKELRSMTAAERAAADAQEHRKIREEGDWLKEFPEAFDYKKVGEETIDGRTAWIIDLSPRPGYQPANIRARVFTKTRGRAWVDASDHALVKLQAEVFETVNIGWGVVGKIQQGTHFEVEQRKIEQDWLPRAQTIRFAARLLLFKSLAQEETTRYSDFQRRSELQAAHQPGGTAAETRTRSTQ